MDKHVFELSTNPIIDFRNQEYLSYKSYEERGERVHLLIFSSSTVKFSDAQFQLVFEGVR